MRNPYLWQQSLRASLFTGLFPMMAAKFGLLLLLVYVAAERQFSLDMLTAGTMALLTLTLLLDLSTVYHLTTHWHRLQRHPWVIVPSALVNLVLAALSMLPLVFAMIRGSLVWLLGDTRAVTWGVWASLVLCAALALLQLVSALRLASRLRGQRVARPVHA